MTLKVEVKEVHIHVHIHADEDGIAAKLNRAADDLENKTAGLQNAVDETKE
jgi:hypothetical protein